MNTKLAFLCDSAFDDRGKLHALGIDIDTVQGESLSPLTHPRFIIVCVVRILHRRSRRQADGRFVCSTPTLRTVIAPIEQGITFSPRRGVVDSKARIIVEVNSVTFKSAGPHAFHVVIDGNEMARLPLNVSLRSG